MKKRILTWLLAISMLGSLLTVPAGAAAVTKFSDVSDSYTATAVESLRLMGVLDGYGDGTFRPDTVLNRAQFCKMAVYAMDGSSELGRYSTVTIFPDVKPSHWASSYINMAAKKGVISGFADGKFKPEQTVTAGQAVTILMRGLGYKDENMGGVWPQSYMAEAGTCGLLKSTGITSAYSALTRAQAAKLFLNLFEAKRGTGEGAVVLFNYTLSKDEVYLTAVDGGRGTITADGKTYDMAHPVNSTSLIGSKGRLVTNGDGDVLTFLPITSGGSVSSAAVIIGSNGSASGLDSLAGSNSYQIYKNGSPATAADLKKYDVATYSASTNSIIVCDTRVSVYYEDSKPSPSNPNTITVLGGTELNVLPSAVESLSAFKPGQQMTILLTADGQVAGAVEPNGSTARSNAIAVVSDKGTVQMICGGALLNIKGSGTGYEDSVVDLSGTKPDKDGKGTLSLRTASGKVNGDLNVKDRTLGGKKLTDNVLIFDGSRQMALGELPQSGVNASRIAYARTNWAGEVDLVVIKNELDVQFGRVFWNSTRTTDPDTGEVTLDESLGVDYGTGKTDTYRMKYNVVTGDFVAFRINKGKTGFSLMEKLGKLSNVRSSAWIGKTAVTFSNRTYEVPSDVLCYNADTGKWINLDTALAYSDTTDLYVYNGVVRVIEVKA
ncbi:S-layer homology domain-containing protein [Oscillibacter valericigenes]|nr:S-layer homology domain-containing protein [Oscillibacter valericigenes]